MTFNVDSKFVFLVSEYHSHCTTLTLLKLDIPSMVGLFIVNSYRGYQMFFLLLLYSFLLLKITLASQKISGLSVHARSTNWHHLHIMPDQNLVKKKTWLSEFIKPAFPWMLIQGSYFLCQNNGLFHTTLNVLMRSWTHAKGGAAYCK